MNNFGEKVSFIWSVADLIRGPYRPNQYKDVMLPMTVLRRLDCVLETTKDKVMERQEKLSGGKVKKTDLILCRVTGVPFYNTSRYTLEKLKGDPDNIARNLINYIKGFSARAREISNSQMDRPEFTRIFRTCARDHRAFWIRGAHREIR